MSQHTTEFSAIMQGEQVSPCIMAWGHFFFDFDSANEAEKPIKTPAAAAPMNKAAMPAAGTFCHYD